MEKMELSEALKANASVLEGLLGINDTWYKGDLVKLLILMKLIILDICLSIKPNHWIINPIHQVIMDSWKRLLLMRSPSSKLL